MNDFDEVLRSIEECGVQLGRAAARQQLGMKAVADGFARGVADELVRLTWTPETTTTPGSRAEAPEARVEVGGELEGTAAGGRTDHPTPAAGASSSAEEDTDWIGWGPLADAIRTIVRTASVCGGGTDGPTTLVYSGRLSEPEARAFHAFFTRVRWQPS